MIRLGLCCKYNTEPIKFRTTTARHLKSLSRKQQLNKLQDIIQDNAEALMAAIRFNAANGIGAFRINSQILPVRTHPDVGYSIQDLPNAQELIQAFQTAGEAARQKDIRLSFHPDQFVVLSAEKQNVLDSSIQELKYQAEVADWVGADVINIHGGGAYGDKESALRRLQKVILALPDIIRHRLTLENDDRIYTPQDLLPICRACKIPLTYDVHHHRCNPDAWNLQTATEKALSTWNREPVFHLSSPINGWDGPTPNRHHDYIDIADFPELWRDIDLTIDIEAKAKEDAILKLHKQLNFRRPCGATRRLRRGQR